MSRYSARYVRNKGRRTSGRSFSALPHAYFQSDEFARLSPRAVKLLINVYCQYRGANNGDLVATWSEMATRGWRSKSQLAKALAELEGTGWLLRTRQGSINRPSLYAVTFCGIDYCGGKLDAGIKSDPRPLHLWKSPNEWQRPLSGRRVKKKRPDRDTGHGTPHGGSMRTMPLPDLPRAEGQ